MNDPLVFIPGLNCTSALFSNQIVAAEASRTIVVANHRRHDRLEDLAAALADELPPRFVLAGLSMGGYVAFALMRLIPERISALILMDTTARPDTEEARERRERSIALAQAGRFSDVPALQIPMLIHPSRTGDEALTGTIRAMAEQTGAEAFVFQQRAIMARPDSRPDLARIACPTLVIVGDGDAITPPEAAQEIADGIAGARLAIMPVCGHLSTIERPAAVTHAMTEFLAAAEV